MWRRAMVLRHPRDSADGYGSLMRSPWAIAIAIAQGRPACDAERMRERGRAWPWSAIRTAARNLAAGALRALDTHRFRIQSGVCGLLWTWANEDFADSDAMSHMPRAMRGHWAWAERTLWTWPRATGHRPCAAMGVLCRALLGSRRLRPMGRVGIVAVLTPTFALSILLDSGKRVPMHA